MHSYHSQSNKGSLHVAFPKYDSPKNAFLLEIDLTHIPTNHGSQNHHILLPYDSKA